MTGMFTAQENRDRVARLRANATKYRQAASRARNMNDYDDADYYATLADDEDVLADEIQADLDIIACAEGY
jgi:hypothetical protein